MKEDTYIRTFVEARVGLGKCVVVLWYALAQGFTIFRRFGDCTATFISETKVAAV